MNNSETNETFEPNQNSELCDISKPREPRDGGNNSDCWDDGLVPHGKVKSSCQKESTFFLKIISFPWNISEYAF